MTRQLISTIIIFILYFTAFGQPKIGVKANVGLSYINTHFESNPPQNETNKSYPMPSGQCGLIYNYRFKDKFIIGTEFLFIPIYAYEYLKLPLVDINGNSAGTSEVHFYRHIYYVGAPLYLGYSFRKLNVNLGLQVNYALASGGKEKGKAIYKGQNYSWENKFDELNINNFDHGICSQLHYKLSDKLSIETNYYFGLTKITPNTFFNSNWSWHIQQLTFGLSYKFGKKKTTTE